MKRHVLRAWLYCRRIYDAFGRHFGGLMAAAVSFLALLSVLPLLSVAVAILGSIVGGSERALHDMAGSIQGYMPIGSTVVVDALREIKRDRGWLGLFGLAGLLISGSAIFANLEVAFNNIWGVTVMRHWFWQRVLAIVASLLIIALLFFSIAITSVLTYLQNKAIPGSNYVPGNIPHLIQYLTYVGAYLVSVSMFVLIYKIIPNKPIQWREAFIGGAFSGIAFEIAKYLFALYLAHYNSYQKVYGSLGSLVILMVWTYYSMTILFLGAEIAADIGTKLPAADEEGLHHPIRATKEG